MVKDEAADARVAPIATGERRGDDRGHPKPQERFAVREIRVHIVGGRGARRHNVLEEPAPLVEIDDEHGVAPIRDRKSTRLNSSHVEISYAVFCLKKKNA